ncbi:helix-turn-helix domain-containing protein [Hungatella hathewayi]|uniref:helix-turn-helix domain-containing protein n=1 Tax=Hungatella hathewayi TaxID=154046 RepID=UPI0035623BF2
MKPNFEIKYHLFDLRKQKNLTERKLSALSGVSKSQINNIETGSANPTLRTICALSLALNVQPCDLFSIEFL